MSGWVLAVPVKPAVLGKSRLRGADADPERHAALARALALDTIEAAAGCAEVARVVVVTDDAALAAALPPGVEAIAEGGPRGIDQAIALGLSGVPHEVPRAALLGDLPALRPEELALALRCAAAHDRAVVADAEGTGSTLVTARAGVALRTAFGERSFARHRALGAHPLALDAPGLRHDVDTLAQLRALGAALGPRTLALALTPHP